jgi:hypothetical protein
LRDSHDVIQKLSAKVTRQIPSWVLLPWHRTLTAARRSLSYRTLLMALQAGRAGAFDERNGHVLQSCTRAHGSHNCAQLPVDMCISYILLNAFLQSFMRRNAALRHSK